MAAWSTNSSASGNTIDPGETLLSRLAKTLRQECGTQSTRDVGSTPQTHSCKNWRHPHQKSRRTTPDSRSIVMGAAPTAKRRSQKRWHQCSCGVGPVQRDLYSAFLAADPKPQTTIPSITQSDWAGARSAPDGRDGVPFSTRKCGATLAPKLWYPWSRSASATKFAAEPTRASASSIGRDTGSVGAVRSAL